MAQLLLDGFTGELSSIDNTTVYVQSILDGNNSINTENLIETNEDDLFQCGVCKKQFNSLTLFLSHKKERCSSNLTVNSSNYIIRSAQNVDTASQIPKIVTSPLRNNHNNQQLQIPSSPMCIFSNGSLLTEADLLSFATFDNIPAGNPVSSSFSQSSQTEANYSESQINSNNKNESMENISLLSPNNGQNGCNNSLGLSLLGTALMNSPYLLTNPTNPEENDSVTLNSAQSQPNNIIIDNSKDEEALIMSQVSQGHSNLTKTLENMSIIEAGSSKNSASSISVNGIANKEVPTTTLPKNDKLSCHYCGKCFTKNFDLQQHIRSHTGEKPFQCIVCGRAFAQKSNVKKHLQTHKVWPNGLTNTIPIKTNETDSSKENDQSSNDASKLLVEDTTAPFIGIIFENSYACPYCPFKANSYFLLKSHMKTHKVEKVYKCILSNCAKMFNDLDSFLEHVKTHEKEMTYTCHLCNKSFDSLYNLGVHQYTHSLYPPSTAKPPTRYYRCNQCMNKYSTTTALEHHMATSSHNYVCAQCNKSFPCERYLRRHLQTHGVENLHACPTCQKRFKTEQYLKVHMLIHSEAKPYICNQCGAAFNRGDKLKRHKLTHDPIKRHKCPFRNIGCLKEFSRPDKLKAHLLTHSSWVKDPYHCKFCDKPFRKRFLLKAHQRAHETTTKLDNELKCNDCDTAFQDEIGLKNHLCRKIVRGNKFKRNLAATTNRYFRSGEFQCIETTKSTSRVYNRRKGRPRRCVPHIQSSQNLGVQTPNNDTDIPTAHIEIITTNDEQLSKMTVMNSQFVSISPNGNKIKFDSC